VEGETVSTTLVTGGIGYVGRHVVELLRERGTAVVSYDRDFVPDRGDGVARAQGELFDIPRLVETMRDHEVTRIIHTAAMSHPELSVAIPITTIAANVEGTVHVLEAARLAGVRRVVNFSSECAYGNRPEDPVTESCRLEPTTPYGVTKAATEMLAHVYNLRYGFDITSLRVTEVYGPGNRMPQYLCELVDAALAGERWHVEEGGDQRFQFVHVSDVARAAVDVSERERLPQEAYNITGGDQIALRDALAAVVTEIPGADLSAGPGHMDLDQQGRWDISAARRDFGYVPAMSMEDGIRDYIAWRRGGVEAGVR
jgi:UDP-glucose 4-epimerase